MQQRKKDATQALVSDFSDYPLEFVAGNANAAAPDVNGGVPVSGVPFSEKQLALYRYVQNLKVNKVQINGTTITGANENEAPELQAM